jgi:NitT/TauT family transport system substrate-binding protein
VLNSYDVLGGPSSATVLYATEKYVKENPKTYRAFIDALAEAAQLARRQNPELAADAYLRVTRRRSTARFLLKVIKDPQSSSRWRRRTRWAWRSSCSRRAPSRRAGQWRDYFFEHPALASGS